MFEKEIKFIADFSLNKIKNLGSFFTFEKLATIDIHPAILRYISAELDYLIYEDRQKLLHQSVFDYSGPEISQLFIRINDQIKKTKRISYEDIKKLVIQAVSFNVNFIARPKWSLTKLVYDTSETKSVDEVKLMFNYIFYYEYIKNIFLSYLGKRKINDVTLIDFELILNKIDKEIFTPGESKKLVDNALYSMTDFFNVGGTVKTRISHTAVEIFMKEKNLIDYLFRLRRAIPAGSKGVYDVEELRKVIYSTVPLEQQQVIAPEEEPEEEIPQEKEIPVTEHPIEEETILPELEIIRRQIESELNDEPAASEKNPDIEAINELTEEEELKHEEIVAEGADSEDELLKMYDDELKELEKAAEEINTDIEEIKFDISHKDNLDDLYDFEEETGNKNTLDTGIIDDVAEELSTSDEYELSFDDEPEETVKKLEIQDDEIDEELEAEEDAEKKKKHEYREDEPDLIKVVEEKKKKPEKKDFRKDIFSYLSNKDIEKIVSNIFNEDREDFTYTMERISECNSYEEATEILKGVFFSYRINPYSRDAVTLTNAVSNYFNQV